MIENPKTTGRALTLLDHFIAGALTPSFSALMGTVFVCGLVATGAIIGISPEFIGSREWGIAKQDTYGSLTSRVLRIRSADSDTPCIGVISASPLRDGISDSRRIIEIVSRDWQDEVRFVNLCAGNLTLWEVVVLADYIADRCQGVFVIEVSPKRFTRGNKELAVWRDNPRLGLRSDLLEGELRRRGVHLMPPTGIYAFDNLEFVAARRYELLTEFLRPPKTPQEHLINNRKAELNLPGMHRRTHALKQQLGGYFDEVDQNMNLLRLAVNRLQQAGKIRVVLVEAPFNPLAKQLIYDDDVYSYILADYDVRIQALARELGTEYWKLDEPAQLEEYDFADEFHLGSYAARDRFTEQLANRLASLSPSHSETRR